MATLINVLAFTIKVMGYSEVGMVSKNLLAFFFFCQCAGLTYNKFIVFQSFIGC